MKIKLYHVYKDKIKCESIIYQHKYLHIRGLGRVDGSKKWEMIKF